ncbi:MAG: dTMP kinase [Clostridia bacterium]|nr:dTMP kinase [Clostridia bacterium]
MARGAGRLITIEGIDGTGKSTQGRKLVDFLRQRGHDALLTREPGGTEVGERIRRLLLDCNSGHIAAPAELFLYQAARAQHVQEVILPALQRGQLVVADRFVDSSLAYQGYGRGLDLELIRTLNRAATGDLVPDLTLLLDLDPEAALARVGNRVQAGTDRWFFGLRDRLEKEGLEFYRRVRQGFLELARLEPERFRVIAADLDPDAVFRRMGEIVTQWLENERI